MPAYASPRESLDLKKTTWKKLLEMMRIYQQTHGLFELAETSKGIFSITSINRRHALFLKLPSGSANAPSTSDPPPTDSPSAMDIREGYTLPAPFVPLFSQVLGSTPHKGETFFDQQQVVRVLWGYVEKKSLSTADGRSVLMDDALAALLCNKRDGSERLVSKKNLALRFARALTPSYTVGTVEHLPDGTQTSSVRVHKGSPPVITVSPGKRCGHTVTIIDSEFEVLGLDPSQLAAALQIHFGCATSLLRPSPKRTSVLLQGAHAKKIAPFLEEKYAISSKYLTLGGPQKSSTPKDSKRQK